jgi:formylglycine-generating enzyme required for sulfatase activity
MFSCQGNEYAHKSITNGGYFSSVLAEAVRMAGKQRGSKEDSLGLVTFRSVAEYVHSHLENRSYLSNALKQTLVVFGIGDDIVLGVSSLQKREEKFESSSSSRALNVQPNVLDIQPDTLTLRRYQRTNKRYTEDLGEGMTLPLMLIPAGEFWMGQTEAETAELKQQVSEEDYQRFYARELARHRVTVPSFFMGKYPVTQAQYAAVMGNNPAEEHDADRFVAPDKPVVGVSWDDAVGFCQRLAERSGKDYRLPSEAEWEYACRAETETPFYFGPTISPELANYDGTGAYGVGPTGEYRRQTTPVGSFPANRWGLCDMHGNVWEWCEDDFHDSYERAPTDGSAWVEPDRSKTGLRVFRGGSWHYDPRGCRSAYRSSSDADNRNGSLGFRVCCSAPTTL